MSTLKKGDLLFADLRLIVQKVENIHTQLDEIRLESTEKFLVGINHNTDSPVYEGGKYYLRLLRDDKTIKLVPIDEDFLDIKRELDRMARKRLAITFVIVGLIILFSSLWGKF